MPHVVRKLPPPGSGDFDEQLWPINLALALLCGCVVGGIWALGDFHASSLLENAYFWLVSLLLSVFVLTRVAMKIGGRRGRRLQFAAMLSVLIHLVVFGAFYLARPSNAEWSIGPRSPVASRTLRDIDMLPDYHLSAPTAKAPRSELEKPLDTSVADERPPLEIARREPPPGGLRTNVPPPAIEGPKPAAPKPSVQPAMADVKAHDRPADLPAPRRGELDGEKIVRRTAPAAGAPASVAMTAPQPNPRPIDSPAIAVAPRATTQGRQPLDAKPSIPRQPEMEIASLLPRNIQPGGPRAEAAPRTIDAAPQATAAIGPALVKTMTQPGPVPRGDGPAPAATAKTVNAEPGQPRPATGLGRQAAPGQVLARNATDPTPAGPAPLAVALATPRPLPTGPAGSNASLKPNIPLAAPAAQPRATASSGSPAAAALDPSRVAGLAPGADPSAAGIGPANPRATALMRAVATGPTPTRPAGPDLSTPPGAGGFGVSVAMAGPRPNRDRPAVGPTVNPANVGPGTLSKAPLGNVGTGSVASEIPSSGLPAAGPPGGITGLAGQGAPLDAPASGPARVGIARSSGGPIGPGRGEGFDAGLPGGAAPATVAALVGSGGAAATHSGEGSGRPGGPAAGPGQAGGLARTVVAGEVPVGATAFGPVGGAQLGRPNADAAGQGTALEVASIATTGRSTIGGPIGRGDGLGGTGATDFAPGGAAISVGIGSGAGGLPGHADGNQQPTVGLGMPGQQLPRTVGGGGGASGIANIAGTGVAASAALPSGSGATGGSGGPGGDDFGPGGPTPNSRATGAARTVVGGGIPGGAPLAGGTTPGDGPGGNGGGGGAIQLAAVQVGRPGVGDGSAADGPSGVAGGTPGGVGTGIGLPGQPTSGGLAAEVKADLPQLPAGAPGAAGGNGTGGTGPGGNGLGNGTGSGTGNGTDGIESSVAGVGRQSGGPGGPGIPGTGAGNGGQPSGSGEGDTAGAPGALLVGTGAPAAGVSGDGAGGPSPVGTGLGALLPKSSAIGLPFGQGGVQGAAPQFAGSPTGGGPGNSPNGAAGGTGGIGPGGPGGPDAAGPGGDGSGHRYGTAGLPGLAGGTGNGPPGSGTGGSGPAGDGPAASPSVAGAQFGLPDRRALPEGDQVAMISGRFLQRSSGGGGPTLAEVPVRSPSASFSGRGNRPGNGPGNGPGGEGPDGKTEASIEQGLAFLARMQAADGHWSLHQFPGATDADTGIIHSDGAATGLALLAYLGAGYDHYDDKYHDVVRRGLEYLLKHQKPDGDLYIPADEVTNESAWLYSHAISSIALCEAYGMTGDKKLHDPAQKALDFIVASQHPTLGGWRYMPRSESDTSVTGWQTTALKSGELAGLKVPKEAYQRVAKWLDSAQVAPHDASRYIYNSQNPKPQEPRFANRPTMTSVALLVRMYLGWGRDNPDLLRGADYIKANLPRLSDIDTRDTYYWYYATQVMFQLKGDYWKAWSERLHPLLVNSQIPDGHWAGSWDPGGRVPDCWGAHGGRIYVTTMNLLSLEVYYRHLPIYEVPQPAASQPAASQPAQPAAP